MGHYKILMNSSEEEFDEISTLSEQLNQSMLQSNATITEVLMQNNFLQDFCQRLLTKYNRERQRTCQLESALNATNVALEHTKLLLSTAETKLAAFRVSPKDVPEAIQSLEACIMQKLTPEIATIMREKLGRVKDAVQKICSEKDYFKQEFEGMLESAMTTVRCRNCRKLFIPKNNSSSACVYHPGKLHYYSCFGCGDDAYFTCCNRCSVCSPGCRTGSHFGP